MTIRSTPDRWNEHSGRSQTDEDQADGNLPAIAGQRTGRREALDRTQCPAMDHRFLRPARSRVRPAGRRGASGTCARAGPTGAVSPLRGHGPRVGPSGLQAADSKASEPGADCLHNGHARVLFDLLCRGTLGSDPSPRNRTPGGIRARACQGKRRFDRAGGVAGSSRSAPGPGTSASPWPGIFPRRRSYRWM